MKHRGNFIIKTIKHNAFYLFLAVVSLSVTIFNLYLTSKLSPLTSRIDSLQKTAYVNAKDIEKDREAINQIPVIHNDVVNIKEDVKEIKGFLYYKFK